MSRHPPSLVTVKRGIEENNCMEDIKLLLQLKKEEHQVMKRLKINDHGYITQTNNLLSEAISEMRVYQKRNSENLSSIDVLSHILSFMDVFPTTELEMIQWMYYGDVNDRWTAAVQNVIRAIYVPHEETVLFDVRRLVAIIDFSNIEYIVTHDLGALERFIRYSILIKDPTQEFVGKIDVRKFAALYSKWWKSLKLVYAHHSDHWCHVDFLYGGKYETATLYSHYTRSKVYTFSLYLSETDWEEFLGVEIIGPSTCMDAPHLDESSPFHNSRKAIPIQFPWEHDPTPNIECDEVGFESHRIRI
jgi:hypothetical protein